MTRWGKGLGLMYDEVGEGIGVGLVDDEVGWMDEKVGCLDEEVGEWLGMG